MLRTATAEVERLGRDYINSLKRDKNLHEDEIDFTLLQDPMIDLAVLSYFAAIDNNDLELARNRRYNTPFRRQMRQLRRDFGLLEVDSVREEQTPRVLESLQQLNARTKQDILDAVQAGSAETATERRTELAQRLSTAGNQLQTQIRTTASLAFNGAHYAQTISDPDVWGYVYITMLDERVRDEHERMHGVTREKTDPIWDVWWPPNGWNCRCRIMHLTREARETDLRTTGGAQPDPGWAFNSGKRIS